MSARTRLAAAALAVGLAGAPGLAQAQSDKVPVIGWLGLASPGAAGRPRAAFLTRLGELGHVTGRTIAIEYRWAEGRNERFPALAADLMKRSPDVIVTPCGPALAAVRASSRSVPVVATCADPTNFLGEIRLGRPSRRQHDRVHPFRSGVRPQANRAAQADLAAAVSSHGPPRGGRRAEGDVGRDGGRRAQPGHRVRAGGGS